MPPGMEMRRRRTEFLTELGETRANQHRQTTAIRFPEMPTDRQATTGRENILAAEHRQSSGDGMDECATTHDLLRRPGLRELDDITGRGLTIRKAVRLAVPHLLVETVHRQQLGMAAALDNPALGEDKNFISVDDGR